LKKELKTGDTKMNYDNCLRLLHTNILGTKYYLNKLQAKTKKMLDNDWLYEFVVEHEYPIIGREK